MSNTENDGLIDPSKSNQGLPRGKVLGFYSSCKCRCECGGCKAKIPTLTEVQKSILASCEHTTKLVDDVQKKGFTLIELLVVLAIICIIGSMIFEAIKHKGIL